jgi:hypothetical protein
MKFRPKTFLISPAFLTAFVVILPMLCQGQTATVTAGSADSTTYSVRSGRPLAEILFAVEHKYLVPVTFEEAPFESDSDLQATPIKQTDGSIYTFHELPVVDFRVTTNALAAGIAVRTVLEDYGAQKLPGVYDMIEDSDRISVFPRRVRTSTGNMRNVSPVMDYPVTFPLATRGATATMELVTSIISKESGMHVEPLNLPFQLTDTITMSANGQSAADLVKQIGVMARVPLSFQCLYTPTTRTYYLILEGVYAPVPAGGAPPPTGVLLLPPMPKAGPSNSAWFTKNP